MALVCAVSHLCDTFFHGRPFDLVCDARLAGGFGRCCLQWMLRKCVGSAVAVVAGAFDTLGAHSTAANYSTRGSFSGKHSPFCTRRSRTHCAYCDLRHGSPPPCASYTAGIHQWYCSIVQVNVFIRNFAIVCAAFHNYIINRRHQKSW